MEVMVGTQPRFKNVDSRAIKKVIYRRWIHFLMTLNQRKLCSVEGLFFNELEPYENIALDIGQIYSVYHLTR